MKFKKRKKIWDTNWSPIQANPDDKTRASFKKIIGHLVDFVIPADHWVNIEESEKLDKYLDLPKEVKKLWKMKVMVISIMVEAFGAVPNNLEKSQNT